MRSLPIVNSARMNAEYEARTEFLECSGLRMVRRQDDELLLDRDAHCRGELLGAVVGRHREPLQLQEAAGGQLQGLHMRPLLGPHADSHGVPGAVRHVD